jgi:hypothetical protein
LNLSEGVLVRRISAVFVLAFCLLSLSAASAGASVIDFESLAEDQSVANHIPGVMFQGAVVVSSIGALDYFNYPPHSGSNVAIDEFGPIWMFFTNPISDFGGYFTYSERLELSAYDKAFNKLGSVTSAFSSNRLERGEPGSAPNEYLSIAAFKGISMVRISGAPDGGSFTVDDVTLTPRIPEPATMSLLILAGVGFAGRRLTRRIRG